MTDTPTDKKLSERFRELVALNEADSLNELIDGHADAILSALRLAESHPSAIREAVEGEREACAKWHDQRAHDTPDAFEMEFHQVSAAAIRARGGWRDEKDSDDV